MTTRHERVLKALEKAARERVDDAGGWVCARTLMNPMVGGNRWNARVHELIEQGVRIEKRDTCVCHQCRYFADKATRRGERPTRLTAWRLTAPVREVSA